MQAVNDVSIFTVSGLFNLAGGAIFDSYGPCSRPCYSSFTDG